MVIGALCCTEGGVERRGRGLVWKELVELEWEWE